MLNISFMFESNSLIHLQWLQIIYQKLIYLFLLKLQKRHMLMLTFRLKKITLKPKLNMHYAVIRSIHVNKTSGEKFISKIYKQQLVISVKSRNLTNVYLYLIHNYCKFLLNKISNYVFIRLRTRSIKKLIYLEPYLLQNTLT